MKADWTACRWGDLATLEYGKGLRKHQRRSGPYQVFGTNGPIGYHDEYLAEGPGVVIGRKGAYREVHRSASPFFVIDTAFFLRALPGVDFDIDWAYYQLKTVDINRLDSGGAIPSTSREAFYDVPVLVPPLGTQRAIASVLAAYDELIENNLRRIEILEEMAQAVYREWFVNFRFPGHEGVPLVDSPLGPIPEAWEVVVMSDFTKTQYGYTASTDDQPVGPKFLRGMDFNKRAWVDWSEVPYCPIEDGDFEKYKVAVGDVLVIRMADPGKVAIVEKDVEAVFASYVVRVTPDQERAFPYWLYYYMASPVYQG